MKCGASSALTNAAPPSPIAWPALLSGPRHPDPAPVCRTQWPDPPGACRRYHLSARLVISGQKIPDVSVVRPSVSADLPQRGTKADDLGWLVARNRGGKALNGRIECCLFKQCSIARYVKIRPCFFNDHVTGLNGGVR